MPPISLHAALAVAAISLARPQPLAAQTSLATPCRAPAAQAETPENVPAIVLGTRTFTWTNVRSLGPNPVPLGSRVTPETPAQRATSEEGAKKPDPADVPTVQAFCVQPSRTIFPSQQASSALLLSVVAASDLTFLRIEVYRGKAGDNTVLQQGATLAIASDGAASQHSMLLTFEPLSPPRPAPAAAALPVPAPFDGRLFIVVSREDAGPGPASFIASVDEEPLAHDTKFTEGTGWFVKSLSAGHAFRYVTDSTAYDRLLTFARCDWVAYDSRQKAPTPPAAPAPGVVKPDAAIGCFSAQMKALRDEIYPLVSNLTGRAYRHESLKGQPRAALSEPMVVFFGLGGSNKILLLDCRKISWNDGTRECSQYAEPWQTTLQRARYVWAVYIEDEQTPFNTSIDVEFKQRAPSVDYEEYDPLSLARPQVTLAPATAGADRVLRVGYRRLRVREPPVAVQLAFSRQGPNYGLRQWVRVYRQFSARWWVVSGAVFVPVSQNAISHIELEPIFPAGGGPATSSLIVRDEPPAPVFAAALWRWPQVRGLADNQAKSSMGLLVNLIPDVIGGLSLPARRHNSYLVGGSWPILNDRLSFVIGAKVYRDEQPTEGFTVGQYVPSTLTVEQVRGQPRHHVDFLFGLAVELVRSR